MTICAQYKGVLYADCACVAIAGQVVHMTEAKKLFISESQRIAFNVTGPILDEADFPKVSAVLERIIQAREATGQFFYEKEDPEIIDLDKRHYQILTRKQAYFYSKDGLITVPHDEILVNGSGAPAFLALAGIDMNPMEIIPAISRLTVTVSKNFGSIRATQLKAFPRKTAK